MIQPFIHKTALVENQAVIAEGTSIWHHAHIREKVHIGKNCIIGKGVYLDTGVKIGNRVKIQNYACVYRFCTVKNDVFIGPHAIITNDKYPRSTAASGSLKKNSDWKLGKTLIEQGVAVGAGAIILPNLNIGRYAMIGAGSVVTQNLHPQEVVVGNPAKIIGYICICGSRIAKFKPHSFPFTCKLCKKK